MTQVPAFKRLIAAGVLLGLSLQALAAEVRIGYAPNTFYAPILVAKQKRWLEEELGSAAGGASTVKWQSFSAGPMMNEAIAAGQLDVIFTGDFPAILGKATGFDVRLIGISSSGYRSQAGVVPANSPIASVKDLKGKKVATFKGTTAHHLLVLALKEAGLKPSDIELVNLTLPDMANALQKGDVDAAFLWEPLFSKLELDRSVKVIRDGKGLKNAIAVIESTESFATKNRNEAKAVLRAFQRGAEFIRRNPDEAAKLVAAELKQPEPIIRRSLDKFTYGPEFSPEIVDALAGTEAFLREQGMTRVPVDINRFVDRSLLREIGGK
ncbi:MAG TPA: aliphatic sulfonate ABC transporter substrate-binding protein [Rhodocyclaceae bacterium]|nr:aliphatic sulfonate ABC transporter substrate-binding protein [Rhodocyclaceae bacterium]